MSVTRHGQQIEKMAASNKEAAGLMGIGDDLMGGAKNLGQKILDSDAADTARLMKEYPEEIPGYLGSKGKEVVDEYGSEMASGAIAGGVSAGAGAASMADDKEGEDKEASIRKTFGLDSETDEPEHSGEPKNRFSRSLAR
jgi:hypothetical protein